jgi:uroporphyrinogen-III synthase
MTQPLSGLKVLVTRPAKQAEPLCQLITAQGGEVIRLPTLEIVAIEPHHALTTCSLAQFDIAIFISVNAVEYAIPELLKSHPHFPQSLELLTVGQRTATRLTDWGLSALCPNFPYNSEALLAMPQLQTVTDKKIVIFRGEGGRELLAETLKQRGAQVEYINVYRRVQSPTPTWVTTLDPNVIVVTSNESLHYLLEMLQHQRWIKQTPLVVMSERIRLEAITLGIQAPIFVAPQASDEGLLQALLYGKKQLNNLG